MKITVGEIIMSSNTTETTTVSSCGRIFVDLDVFAVANLSLEKTCESDLPVS